MNDGVGRRGTRLLWWAAALLAVLALAAVQSVRAYRGGEFAAEINTRPPRTVAALPADPEAKRLSAVSFESPGPPPVTLRGWYAPAENGAAVVFVHGYGGNRAALWPEARVLIAAGYGALLFDLRASGDSGGDRVTYGDAERADVRAAVDFVARQRGVRPGKIGVFAFSMGGWAATPEVAGDARVGALVLAGVTSSFVDQRHDGTGLFGFAYVAGQDEGMRRLGIDLTHARAIDSIAAIAPRPLLLVRGSLDTTVPARWIEPLFARALEPKELYTVPGAGHGGYAAAGGDAFAQKERALFARALSPATSVPP